MVLQDSLEFQAAGGGDTAPCQGMGGTQNPGESREERQARKNSDQKDIPLLTPYPSSSPGSEKVKDNPVALLISTN